MQRIVNNAMSDAKEMGEQSSSSTPPENMRKITLYRNGFTVDDGPFRDLDSPESKQFLASLSEGYIPREVRLPFLLLCLAFSPHPP
jgi:UBX domain-containing protein 1